MGSYKEFKEDRKDTVKWVLWISVIILMLMIIFGAARSIGLIGQTAVENAIFQNSYQKQSADKKAKNVFAAQLAEIDYQLAHETDEDTIYQLKKQQAMLRVQSASIK